MTLKIYEKSNGQSTSEDEFNAIKNAIQAWNSTTTSSCSNVNFIGAARTNRVWPGLSEGPGQNEIIVVRTEDRDGQFLAPGGGNPAGITGGIIWLRSTFDHVTIPRGKGPGYRVDNLAKHEAGHSFGVENGIHTDPPSDGSKLIYPAHQYSHDNRL